MAAVLAEPLRESAQRALVSAYLAEGNCWEALRQYEAYKRLLHRELRLAPSALMLALIASLRAETHE